MNKQIQTGSAAVTSNKLNADESRDCTTLRSATQFLPSTEYGVEHELGMESIWRAYGEHMERMERMEHMEHMERTTSTQHAYNIHAPVTIKSALHVTMRSYSASLPLNF